MDHLTVATLVQALQEPNTDLLTKVLRILGQDRCAAILADTLQREANGGMLTKDGTRRRTPGGVFF
jgi:phosphorylated adapter RNA export protein